MNNSTRGSTTAEHALRALVEMASLPDGNTIRGKQLAQAAGIPSNYLSKILWTLGNAGLIDATRGSGGGYRMRRLASDIRLFEVVELFDRQRWKQRCFLSGEHHCDESNQCPAHDAWRGVRAVYTEFLELTTIADFARPCARRTGLVSIAGCGPAEGASPR